MAEHMTREEAILFLTMQRDKFCDTLGKTESFKILEETGDTVGYTPAFRCLVKGESPEESIRWGK